MLHGINTILLFLRTWIETLIAANYKIMLSATICRIPDITFLEFVVKNGHFAVERCMYMDVFKVINSQSWSSLVICNLGHWRAVRLFKDAMKKLSAMPTNVEGKIAQFLFCYHITPHATTSIAPAKLLVHRQLKSYSTCYILML